MNNQDRQRVLDTLDLLGVDYSGYKPKYYGDESVCQVLPVSGGKDSKVMAMIHIALFPEIPWYIVFTDTGAELDETYQELDAFEKYLGRPIVRVEPDRDLYELIEDANGFLPSQRDRYCTAKLKLKAMDHHLAEVAAEKGFRKFVALVAIRMDEDRFGRVADNDDLIDMALPYLELNIDKQRVNQLLAATAGIPKSYRHRTRSGCSCCFYQRRTELVSTLIYYPADARKAAYYEKLSDQEMAYCHGLAAYEHLKGSKFSPLCESNYFIPKPVGLLTQDAYNPPPPKKQKDTQTLDLFGPDDNKPEQETLFAAVAFLVHPLMGLFDPSHHGVYQQKLITFSPSLAGLKRSLAFHYEHLLDTAEMYCSDQSQLMEHLRIGIFQIQFDKGTLPLAKKDAESYVWSPDGYSYMRLEMITKILHSTLVQAALEQNIEDLSSQIRRCIEPELTWQWEHIQRDKRRLAGNDLSQLGKVVWSGMYEPPSLEKLPGILQKQRQVAKRKGENEALLACVACSL